MLSFKEIRDLIDLVAERGLSGLEIEQTGFRIRIEGARAAGNGTVTPASAPLGTGAPALPLAPGAGPPTADAEPDQGLHVIRSPIVGTFYAAPSPEAGPFVKVGDAVEAGLDGPAIRRLAALEFPTFFQVQEVIFSKWID